MATKQLKSIKFPGLSNVYVIPEGGSGGGGGTIDIDLEGAEPGTGDGTIVGGGSVSGGDATTLNGKTESQLNVAKAIDADKLGGITAENYATKEQLNDDIVNRIIYGKGKNLLKNTANSQTINGVTFTVNDDGSVTANGTATDAVYFYLIRNDSKSVYSDIVGKVISGCNGGSDGTYGIYVTYYNQNTNIQDIANFGGSTVIPENSGASYFSFYIYIWKGYTANNLTFYPMIRLASETDDTYEPCYEGLKDLAYRGMTLLWENASIASEFAAQYIDIDCTGYDYIGIAFIRKKDSVVILDFSIAKIEEVIDIRLPMEKYLHYRLVSIYADYIDFTDNQYMTWGNTTKTVDNSYIIPARIYGIKGVM